MQTAKFQQSAGELIAQSRGGDREAFGRIVRHYQAIVSGVTFGILGDFHKSEDIAQETFLVAWRKLDELREIEKLPGWLCGIARNLSKQYLIRQPNVRVVPVSQSGDIAEHGTGYNNDPAELLAKQEQNRLIWAALEKIPEKYRVPLVLFYRSGQSVSEIATALELSENALNVRLTRARRFLRKELEKQVEGTIATSGPGEMFSLAVIAALPTLAAMTPTGKAIAATVIGTGTLGTSTLGTGVLGTGVLGTGALGTESTLAVGMATAPKSGGSGATLFGSTSSTLWWYTVQPFVLAVGFMLSCFFWIIGATPGIWFSIRNAPTLRARRYLVLASLRVHLILAIWLFGLAFGAIFVDTLFDSSRASFYRDTSYFCGLIGGWVLGIITVGFLIATQLRYYRIMREEAGLIRPKTTLPLEESPLSFQRLSRSHRRILRVLLVMLFVMSVLICSIAVFVVYKEMLYAPKSVFVVRMDMLDAPKPYVINPWTIFFSYYGWRYVILGILFLLVFRKVHRYFLAIIKDEEAFASAPPLVTRETPYWERAWIEWNVTFGLFLTAILIYVFAPRWLSVFTTEPVSLFFTMILLFAGSFLVAMTSARFPLFRWIINIAGGLLICVGVMVMFSLILPTPERWKYLNALEHWPIVFSFMILDYLLCWTAFMLLLYGGLSLKRKWSGGISRFTTKMHEGFLKMNSSWSFVNFVVNLFASLRETKLGHKVTGIYCIGVVLILIGAFFQHNTTKVKYCYFCGMFTRAITENLNDDDVRRSADFFCEALRLAPELSKGRADTMGLLSATLSRCYKNNPEVVLTGYDRAIAVLTKYDKIKFPHNDDMRKLIGERGAVQFLNGEYRAAVEDFSRVADAAPFPEFLYYRGFAYEKLGETELALADYSAAINHMEEHELQHIMTILDHKIPESDIQQTQWFGVTLDELKAIREKLESQK